MAHRKRGWQINTGL